MPSLISPNQSALIKGRQLVDGVVAVNEVIDLARKSKRACFIFKVDFEKAYDYVSWSFLDYMMMRFGFGSQWRSWIRVCVFNGNLTVLVNGCPTEEINIQRGLKQGDPLAQFLFLLVVEGLSGAIFRAEELGMFKGFKVGNNGLFVPHLQYADDTIFLGEASVENLWTLKMILRCFELASGLKVNFAKSSVMGVNVSADFLNVAERFLHCSVGSIPFSYLGLPVGANPRKESTWKPFLVSLSRKLGVVPCLGTMSGGGKGYGLLGAWPVALEFQMDEGAVCG
ncbi:LINE-1 reverse transcriptase like [Trifolium medium]|uniref:LINE-1 reverse transcriptase like n=1 Tax=Trifolium medium TaxID=97028 RepID=A0A392MKS6_9FABA|nr:LINE-1 reverse transcriptase like [Trifolium medium]